MSNFEVVRQIIDEAGDEGVDIKLVESAFSDGSAVIESLIASGVYTKDTDEKTIIKKGAVR